MARSNGHNGHPQGHPGEAVPQWRHPSDPVPHPHAPPPQHYPQFAAPAPAYPASPDLPSYGQQPVDVHQLGHAPPFAQPSQQGAWPQPAAPGYDLNQYGHGATPQPQDPYARPLTAPPQAQSWAPQQPYTQPPHDLHQLPSPASFAEPPRGQHAFQAAAPMLVGAATGAGAPALGAAYGGPRGAPPPQSAQQPYAEDEYDEDPLEDEDEPKRGRKLMVVGALVGAICVGGGLAYAYRAFSGGKTPLVATKSAPKPTAPAAPAKIAVKLPDAVPAQAVAAAPAPDEGPRRVQTIAVTPPGANAAPAPQPTPPPSTPVMPGMVLDNFPRAVPSAPPPIAAAAPVTPLRPAAPPTPPQQQAALPVARPQPPAAPVQPKVTSAPAAAAVAPVERKAAPVAKAKAADAYNPNAATGASGGVAPAAAAPKAASAGSNGYVATLLSTQKGRPEAMKAFADLQQKYPDVLGGKPAEVQEKDLGPEKGIWYRAVVGPPGSRTAASEVCTQMKASGYANCFVSSY